MTRLMLINLIEKYCVSHKIVLCKIWLNMSESISELKNETDFFFSFFVNIFSDQPKLNILTQVACRAQLDLFLTDKVDCRFLLIAYAVLKKMSF